MATNVQFGFLLILLCMSRSRALPTDSDIDPDSKSVIELKMPGVTTLKADDYLCTAMIVPEDEAYITSFEATPDGDSAHHLLVFGCSNIPVKPGKTWNCASGCQGQSNIMFAWALHADPTILPPDIGFEIGGSRVRYISLQVHYKTLIPDPNYTGIRMKITKHRPQYLAGILIMAASTQQSIPPHMEKYHIDLSCKFDGKTSIHPFAFRVHAHTLATVITGYQYNDSWHLLKKGNPQWPQAFYPVAEKFEIKPNDILVSRCTYNSMDKSETVNIGSTHNDEMCNFYMMYYTDPDRGRSFYQCVGNTEPEIASLIPADSDVPLPSNPLLEEIAHGKHHEHADEPQGVHSSQYNGGYSVYGNGFGIREVPDWPSESHHLGQISAVSTDSEGNVHVFHRVTRLWDTESFGVDNVFKHRADGPIKADVISTFDVSGKLINSWGANMFYMPHGLHVDNMDNIWITDVAMQQIMRFPKGSHTADMVLGEAFVPGTDTSHFCKPTGVATLRNGQFYVSDGYCNARVIKFSADGKVLKQWGIRSSSLEADRFPPPTSFYVPHSISIFEDKNLLAIADRENQRIQCFDLEGNFRHQMHAPDIPGKVFAVSFNPVDGALFAVNGKDDYNSKITLEGFIFDAEAGKLIKTWSPLSAQFEQLHDIAVSADGRNIYVVQLSPEKIWKFSITADEAVSHHTQKKLGHPESIEDDLSSDDNSEEMLEKAQESDFGASLIIGGLLVIPVVIIVAVTIFLRLKKNGRLPFLQRSRNRRLNLGTLLSRGRHQFSPVSTDDKDAELDPLNSESEVEEYSININHNA